MDNALSAMLAGEDNTGDWSAEVTRADLEAASDWVSEQMQKRAPTYTRNPPMSDETMLKPCPFCGGEPEIIHIDEGENAGGSCVCCTKCQASSNVEFEFKENFVSNWNRRSTPSTRDEVEPTEAMVEAFRDWYALHRGRPILKGAARRVVRRILAAAPPSPPHPKACKGCGHVGPVPADKIACCPDGKRYDPTPTRDGVGPVAGEVVAWVSPEQLAAHTDRPESPVGGLYLPVRKARAGLFTQPLYAAPPDPQDDALRRAFDVGVDVGYRDITGREAPQSFKDKKWAEALAAGQEGGAA